MTPAEFEQLFAAYICGFTSREQVIAVADDYIQNDKLDPLTEFLSLSGSLSEKNFRLEANRYLVDIPFQIGMKYVLGILSVKYATGNMTFIELLRWIRRMEMSGYLFFDGADEPHLAVAYEDLAQAEDGLPLFYESDVKIPLLLKKYERNYWESALNPDWIVI